MRHVSGYLLPLYAVATLFPRLLALPGLPAQGQLTELLFPLLLWAFRAELLAQVRRFPYFSAALLAYVAANVASALWAGYAGAVLEALGRAYLAVVALIATAHADRFGTEAVRQWWKWGTVAVAMVCLAQYGWVLAGGADPLYFTAHISDYPYFGGVHRLRGTAQVYGMLYMLLLPGLFFAYEDRHRGKGPLWPVMIVAAAGGLTFGKENLLLPIGLLLYHAGRPAVLPKGALLTVAGGLALFLLVGTHYLIGRGGEAGAGRGYTAGSPVLSFDNYDLLETNYTINKRTAVQVGLQHPLLGVGPGRYASATEALAAAGRYPTYFGRFDPHSAWTGAFAETGLLGLLALCALVGSLWYYRPAGALDAVGVVLLLFLLASIFKDVMNFRGLWVLVGLYLAGVRR